MTYNTVRPCSRSNEWLDGFDGLDRGSTVECEYRHQEDWISHLAKVANSGVPPGHGPLTIAKNAEEGS